MLVRTLIGRYKGTIVDLPAHVARRLLLDGRAVEIQADAGVRDSTEDSAVSKLQTAPEPEPVDEPEPQPKAKSKPKSKPKVKAKAKVKRKAKAKRKGARRD